MWPFKTKSLKEQKRDLEVELAANAAQLEIMTQLITKNSFYDHDFTEFLKLKAEDARLKERLKHLKEDMGT